MKKTVLRNYARLIAHVGVNIQKGQEVMIFAEVDQAVLDSAEYLKAQGFEL